MKVVLRDGGLEFDGQLRISVQRTLRVPDDGGAYPLPPGLGRLPLLRAHEIGLDVPPDARDTTFVVAMYQREAFWIGFDGRWPPHAVQVSIGAINAISGKGDAGTLSAAPQDYVICPDQLWLDGINTGIGVVRQFVAMPLGSEYSVEHAMTGAERVGGVQLTVYPPVPGAIPLEPPDDGDDDGKPRPKGAPRRMGIGAGGRIAQKIYPDPYGADAWDLDRAARVHVEILNSEQFLALAGHMPPPAPMDAATYTKHGLPWFALYEEHKQDLAASAELSSVRTIADRDRELGSSKPDPTVAIDPRRVHRIDPRDD